MAVAIAGLLPTGRPTKLTAETTERICYAIRLGATYAMAAQYGGCSGDVLNDWINLAQTPDHPRHKPAHLQFFQALKEAEADGVTKMLAVIDKAAIQDGQWAAAAWKLERRYPADYGRRQVEITGTSDKPLRLEVVYRDEPITAVVEPVLRALAAPQDE